MGTLAATRSAQRIDMALLIPQVEIAGPSAVARVRETVNDSRQPSRAALEQRLGVELELSGTSTSKLRLRLPGFENVTLSPLARAVNALLVSQSDPALKIRGSEPLWLHSRPPVTAQLTARLAQTVVFSGLFYESHLQQFAAGSRPLSLMIREPQAGLAGLVPAASTAVPQAPAPGAFLTAGFDALDADTLPGFAGLANKAAPATALPAENTTATSSGPVPFSTVYGRDGKPVNNALLLHETAGAMQTAKATVSGPLGDLLRTGSTVIAQASLAPAALSVASPAVLMATRLNNSLFPQETTRNVQTTEITSAQPQDQRHSSSTVAEVIHPAAMELVRQQLELLSVPVFRWCGQAWPGTPLEWDVQKEQPEDAKASEGQASLPAWTTNLTLSMPILKSVQARLTLVGNILQVRLVCDEDATLAVLDESRNTLAQRFAPLGLQLATLHIGMAGTAGDIGLPKISGAS